MYVPAVLSPISPATTPDPTSCRAQKAVATLQLARFPMTRCSAVPVVLTHRPTVNGPVPALSDAASATLTSSSTPSNARPRPYRLTAVRVTPDTNVPGLSLPALSTAVVPLASSNPKAATSVAVPDVVENVWSPEVCTFWFASTEGR